MKRVFVYGMVCAIGLVCSSGCGDESKVKTQTTTTTADGKTTEVQKTKTTTTTPEGSTTEVQKTKTTTTTPGQ